MWLLIKHHLPLRDKLLRNICPLCGKFRKTLSLLFLHYNAIRLACFGIRLLVFGRYLWSAQRASLPYLNCGSTLISFLRALCLGAWLALPSHGLFGLWEIGWSSVKPPLIVVFVWIFSISFRLVVQDSLGWQHSFSIWRFSFSGRSGTCTPHCGSLT